MDSVKIQSMNQQDIWTYYLGYLKCELALGTEPYFVRGDKEVALVYLTSKEVALNKDKKRVEIKTYSRGKYNLHAIGISTDQGKVQARLDYVMERYFVFGVFNLTDADIVGENHWDEVKRNGLITDLNIKTLSKHFLDMRNDRSLNYGWGYNCFGGQDNYIPPIIRPEVGLDDTTVLKAFAMCLPNDKFLYNQMHVGQNQFWNAGGKIFAQHTTPTVRDSYGEMYIISLDHPDVDTTKSLSIGYLENVLGKDIATIEREAQAWTDAQYEQSIQNKIMESDDDV